MSVNMKNGRTRVPGASIRVLLVSLGALMLLVLMSSGVQAYATSNIVWCNSSINAAPDGTSADGGWARIYFANRTEQVGDPTDFQLPQGSSGSVDDQAKSYLVDKVGPNGNTGTSGSAIFDSQGFNQDWAPADSTDDLVVLVDLNTSFGGYTTSSRLVMAGNNPEYPSACTLQKIGGNQSTGVTKGTDYLGAFRLSGTSTYILWPAIQDDLKNVAGYRVYRTDGSGWSPVGTTLTTAWGNDTTEFQDNTCNPVTSYDYAISVLYRGKAFNGTQNNTGTLVESYYKSFPASAPADVQAPLITINNQPNDPTTAGYVMNVTATVADDIDVDQVRIVYNGPSVSGNVSMTNWEVATVTHGSTTLNTSGNWSFHIPETQTGQVTWQVWVIDSSGNANMTGLAFFNVTSDASDYILVTPDPTTMTAGHNKTFTITMYDQYDNLANDSLNATVFDLASTSGAGQFNATGTSTTITDVTIPIGDTSVTFDYWDTLSSLPGTWTLTVTHDLAAITGDAATVTVYPGDPYELLLTPVSNVTVSADVASQGITAHVVDAFGNNVNASTTVNWVLYEYAANAGVGAGLSGASSTTVGTTGVATVTLTTSVEAGDAYWVNATAGAVLNSTANVTVIPGAVTHFNVTRNDSGSAAIPDQTAGQGFQVNVSARDAFENLVTDYAGRVYVDGTPGNAPDGTAPDYGTYYDFTAPGGGWHVFPVTLYAREFGVTISAHNTTNNIHGTSSGFDVVPAGLDHIVTTPAAYTEVSADAPSITITATAYDQYNNTIPGVTIDMEAIDIAPANANAGFFTDSFLTTTSGVSDDIGMVNKTYSTARVSQDNWYVNASSGAVYNWSAEFRVVPGDIQTLTVQEPTVAIEVNADLNATGIPIKVEARDNWNNLVYGANINWSATDFGAPANAGGNAFSGFVTQTNATGVAEVSFYAGTTSGDNWFVTANNGSVNANTPEISVVPGTITTMTILTPTLAQDISADANATTVEARATDQFGNYVYDALITWSGKDWDATPNGGGNGFSAFVTQTNSTGVATVTFYPGTYAGDNWQVNATNGSVTAGTPEIRVVAGGTTAYDIVGPATLNAGQTGTYDVFVRDAHGNLANVTSFTTIVLDTNSSTGVFSRYDNGNPQSFVTIAGGGNSAKFNFTDTKVGVWSVNGTETSFILADDHEVVEIVPAGPYNMTLIPDQATVLAYENVTYTLYVYDIFGNDYTAGFGPVNLTTTSVNGTFWDAVLVQQITDVAVPPGQNWAQFKYSDSDPDNDPYTIYANDSSPVINASATVYVNPANAARIFLASGDGQTGIVDSNLTAELVVFVDDGVGNPVPGTTIVWTIGSVPGGADLYRLHSTAGSGQFSVISTTNGTGHANVTLHLGDTTGTYTVNAQSGGLTGSPITFTATADPGALGSLVVTDHPGTTEAGRLFNFNVTAYDVFGNLKTDYNGAITLSSGDPYPADLLTDDGGNWTNGKKMFNATLFTSPSQYLAAADGSIEGNVTIAVNPAAPSTITIAGGASPYAAGGAGASYTATILDAYGNANGTALPTWSVWQNGTGASIDGAGNFDPGTIAGMGTVNVSTTGGVNDSMAFTVLAGPGDHIVVTPAGPHVFTADATGYVNFTAWVEDQYGNPTGDAVTFVFSANGTAAVWNGGTTNVTDTGTVAGEATLDISALGGSLWNNRTITINPGAGDHVVVTPAGPHNFTADAPGYVNFTAWVEDQYGNPTGDAVVFAFSTQGTAATWDATWTNVTDTGTVSGAAWVNVSAPGSLWNNQTITINPGAPDSLVITPSGTTSFTAGGAGITYTAAIFDAFGNVNTTAAITWSSWNGTGNGTFNPSTGDFTPGTSAGSGYVNATWMGLVNASEMFDINPDAPAWIDLSPAGPQNYVAGGTGAQYTATVYDQFDNVNGTAPVNWDTWNNTGNGTVTGAGWFAPGTRTGNGTVNVTSGPVVVSSEFAITPAALGELRFSDVPGTVSAGQDFTFNVTAYDIFGNLKDDFTGELAFTSSDGLPFAATFGIVGPWSAGVREFNCTLYSTPSQWIRAENGSVSNQTTVNVSPLAPDHLVITPDPLEITAGAQDTITITTYDMYENVAPVAGATNVGLATTSGTGEFREVGTGTLIVFFIVTITDGTSSVQADYFDTAPGLYTLNATKVLAGGSEVGSDESTAIVNPADIAGITIQQGNDQAGTVDTTLPVTLVVNVTNGTGGAVAWANVIWTVVSVPGGATTQYIDNGTHQAQLVITYTNASGLAEVTLHLGEIKGEYVVNATAGGYYVHFHANATSGAPVNIVVTPSAPVTVSADVNATAITATAWDQFGNLVEDGTELDFVINDVGAANVGTEEYLSAAKAPTTGGVASITFYTSHTTDDDYNISAGNGSAMGYSASITVIPGALDYITITPGSFSDDADGTQDFDATGYDQWGNVNGSLVESWETSDPWGGINSTTGVYEAGQVGSWLVWCNNTSPFVTASVIATVTGPGVRASIAILPAGPVSMLNGTSKLFEAFAYDVDGNLIGPALANWSIAGGIGPITPSATINYTTFSAEDPGIGNLTADDGLGNNDTVEITVEEQAIAYIRIEFLNGTEAGDFGLNADEDGTVLRAIAYNATYFSLGEIPVSWAVTGGIGTTAPSTGSTTTLTVTTVGTGKVLADDGDGNFDTTGIITVTVGALDSIIVTPSTHSMTADETHDFDATAYDADGNLRTGDVFAWAVTDALGSIDGNGLYDAVGAGSWTVYANASGISGTATVNVGPGVAATVAVSPVTYAMTADETRDFDATAYDADGNVLPAPTFMWTSNDTAANLDANGLFTAATEGIWSVNATTGAATGTALVTVTPGVVASVVVAPGIHFMQADETYDFDAAGYDADGNEVPGAVFTWDTNASLGVVNAVGVFNPGDVGTWAVNATNNSVVGTAIVTVEPGAITTINVNPATHTMTADETFDFDAAGYDSDGNLISGLTFVWSTNDTSASVDANGLFDAATAGIWAVNATNGGITGTALVTVTPGELASIVVTPADGTYNADQEVQYAATGYDADGNLNTTWAGTWAVTDPTGDINGTGYYYANTTGTWTVYCNSTAPAVSGFTSVTVTPGSVASVVVTPEFENVSADDTVAYAAIGYDADGNVIPGMVFNWSVDDATASMDADGTFHPHDAGSWNVTAENSTITGTAQVNVTAGAPATIELGPWPSMDRVAGPGDEHFTYTIFDIYGNENSTAPVAWSVTNVTAEGSFNSTEQNLTWGTKAGYGFVNIQSGAAGNTTQFNVTPAALNFITVDPAGPLTQANNTSRFFRAYGFDQYGNARGLVNVSWSVENNLGSFAPATDANTTSFSATLAGMGNVTANLSGVANATVFITVLDQPVAYIMVEYLNGTEVGALFNTTDDDSLVLYARAYNATGLDLGDIEVNWSVTGGIGLVSPATGPSATLELTTVGTGQVVAEYLGLTDLTGLITVSVGALDHIAVTPAAHTMNADGTFDFDAASYDADGNVRTGDGFVWTTNDTHAAIDAAGLFTAAKTGTWNVSAANGTFVGKALVTVTPGAVAYINLTPNSITLTADDVYGFAATAYDADWNVVLGVPFAWDATDPWGAVGATGVYEPGQVGSWMVYANASGISGTANVNVDEGALASIVLSPLGITMTADDEQDYAATGYDADGNVNTTWTGSWSTTDPNGDVNAAGHYWANTTGTWEIKCQLGSVQATTTVTVNPGGRAYIEITPSGPVNMAVSQLQVFNAVAVDADGNAIGPAFVNWSVGGGMGNVTPTQGTSTTFESNKTGAGNVSADDGLGNYADVDILVMAGGAGYVSIHYNLTVGAALSISSDYDDLVLTAWSYDASGVPLSTVNVTWSILGTQIGNLNSSWGHTIKLEATTVGTAQILAVDPNGRANVTVEITVIAGNLSYITVTPAGATFTADDTQDFNVAGFDADGNAIAGLTFNWTTNDTGASIDANGTFAANNTGVWNVTAMNGTVEGMALFTVTTGALDSIVVTPGTASVTAGNTRDFDAQGYDAKGNPITGLTYAWSTDDADASVSVTGLFSAYNAGSWSVNATVGGVTGTATVTVTAAAPASVTLTPGPTACYTAGPGSDPFTYVATDAYGNQNTTAPPVWTFVAGTTLAEFDNVTWLLTWNTAAGAGSLQVTVGGQSDITSFVVNPAAPFRMTVDLSPAIVRTAGPGSTTLNYVFFDAYDNVNTTAEPEVTLVVGSGVVTGVSVNVAGHTVQLDWGTTAGTGSLTLSNGTATNVTTIQANTGTLAGVQVVPGAAAITADGSVDFDAQGVDQYGNAIAGLVFNWTTNDPAGQLNQTGYFNGTTAGTWYVNATNSTFTGSATITVTPGMLANVNVTPDPLIVTVGEAQELTIHGYDADWNRLYGVRFDVAVQGAIGTVRGEYVFNAETTVATGSLNVSNGTVFTVVPVDVVADEMWEMTILLAGVPAGPFMEIWAGNITDFDVEARDRYDNLITDAEVLWSATGGIGSVVPDGSLTASQTPAKGWLIADNGSVQGKIKIAVIPGPVFKITVEPNYTKVDVGLSQRFEATAYDTYGNVLYGIEFTWSVSGDVGTISPGSGVFLASAGGMGNVTAAAGAATGTASVEVPEPPVDTDGDGIPDSIDTDKDGDGLPDDWEEAHGLDPMNPNDADTDADDDGLTNLQEWLRGTDPASGDSDDDGIPDSDDVAPSTRGEPSGAGETKYKMLAVVMAVAAGILALLLLFRKKIPFLK